MEINEIIRLEVTSFSLSSLPQVRSIASIPFLTDYFSNLNISNDEGSLAYLAWRLRFLVEYFEIDKFGPRLFSHSPIVSGMLHFHALSSSRQ